MPRLKKDALLAKTVHDMIDVKRSLQRVHKYAAEYLCSRIRDERRECLSGVGAESILIHIAINILLTQNIYLLFYEEAILYGSMFPYKTECSRPVVCRPLSSQNPTDALLL